MNSDEGGLLSVLKECLNTMAGLQKYILPPVNLPNGWKAATSN